MTGVVVTADQFVNALRDAIGPHPVSDEVREWAGITRRRRPLFEHPPDPVLDLLARYDLSQVRCWQLAFSDGTAPCFDGFWHVATKTTDAYYVLDGQLHHMYYKADHPAATGLSSEQFLDVLTIYARMVAATPMNPSGPRDSVFDDYARQAAAVSPSAAGLDWFRESSRR